MNTYEQKVQEKRERYADLAVRKRQESDAAYQKSRAISDMIPFGQPILVGHHSERGHRRDIEKINSNMRKSIELSEIAGYYEKKAENYGENGISSEDPEALDKLKEKLAAAVKEHEIMKQARKKDKELVPSYCLTNSNGRIRAIRQRIETLERMQTREQITASGDGWKIYEDDSRICYESNGKPGQETIAKLKHRGFKWSPTRTAWVRLTTPNALYSTKWLIKELCTTDIPRVAA